RQLIAPLFPYTTLFRSGWDVHVESFQILFPTPKERVLEMVEPVRVVAKLQEPPIPEDPTSSQQAEQLPSYNAYSIDGDVTAPLRSEEHTSELQSRGHLV